jgi:DNA-binding transcriptional ArsR family regulator
MNQQTVEQHQHRGWTFITHHAQVLLAIARDPDVRVTEIARAARITERYAYRVLSDLQRAGYVRRSRRGRRNLYELNAEAPLGDPVVEEESLRHLLRVIGRGERGDLLEVLASRRDADSSLARSREADG